MRNVTVVQCLSRNANGEKWSCIHIRNRINTYFFQFPLPMPTKFGWHPSTCSWVIVRTDGQTQTDRQTHSDYNTCSARGAQAISACRDNRLGGPGRAVYRSVTCGTDLCDSAASSSSDLRSTTSRRTFYRTAWRRRSVASNAASLSLTTVVPF